jgi:hypothetical protein
MSKVMKDISRSTIGRTVDNVADYVDLVSQLIVEYFNQRYKIQKKVEDIKRATLQTLFALKIGFIKTMVETMFLLTGLLALIVGMILLLTKVMPLEYVLIGYGLIVCIIVLLRMKVKV